MEVHLEEEAEEAQLMEEQLEQADQGHFIGLRMLINHEKKIYLTMTNVKMASSSATTEK